MLREELLHHQLDIPQPLLHILRVLILITCIASRNFSDVRLQAVPQFARRTLRKQREE